MYVTYSDNEYGDFNYETKLTNCDCDKDQGNSYYVKVPSDELYQNLVDHYMSKGILSSEIKDSEGYVHNGDDENNSKHLILYLPIENKYFVGKVGKDIDRKCINKQSDGKVCGTLNNVLV